MVHGVGTHVPGYSARLSANLAQALGLTVIAPEAKEFPIEAPAFPGEPLGELTVTRHTNTARDREMLFYELTWSPISQPAKDALRLRRHRGLCPQAGEPQQRVQEFVNDVAADPLVYTGIGRERIQTAVGQALCWALSTDWQGLPDQQQLCTPDNPAFASRLDDDEFVFITHSLGSRITTDGLQRLTGCSRRWAGTGPRSGGSRARSASATSRSSCSPTSCRCCRAASSRASVQGAVPAYCLPDGAALRRAACSSETELIAFSDPNDLLSYPIPDAFVRDYVNSRLCPKQVNVTINIAPVADLLGLGEFANPLAAHRRLRRRRARDRPDHPRHRPARDRPGGQGALLLARGQRGPALTVRQDEAAAI